MACPGTPGVLAAAGCPWVPPRHPPPPPPPLTSARSPLAGPGSSRAAAPGDGKPQEKWGERKSSLSPWKPGEAPCRRRCEAGWGRSPGSPCHPLTGPSAGTWSLSCCGVPTPWGHAVPMPSVPIAPPGEDGDKAHPKTLPGAGRESRMGVPDGAGTGGAPPVGPRFSLPHTGSVSSHLPASVSPPKPGWQSQDGAGGRTPRGRHGRSSCPRAGKVPGPRKRRSHQDLPSPKNRKRQTCSGSSSQGMHAGSRHPRNTLGWGGAEQPPQPANQAEN